MTEELSKLIDAMKQYLRGEIRGSEIVKTIDNFVSDDFSHDLPDELNRVVMSLQDRAAMYVAQKEKRAEYEGYIGDGQLKTIVASALDRLQH
jgi:hypothetical protein